jgi:dipeptidyl aminopeptidase/acylaminoacyl peptidase
MRSRSPLYRAEEIDTPLLALHGEEDLACPVEDMREFDKAVQEKASLSGDAYRFEVF